MACNATNFTGTLIPRPCGTTAGFFAAVAAALGLHWAATALPAHLEATMGLPPHTYAFADLLTLRGAVVEQDLDVLSAVAASERDFDALVAAATAGGHGSRQFAQAGR